MDCLKNIAKVISIFGLTFLITVLPDVQPLLAISNNWEKLASDVNGAQFINTDTIKYKKNILSFTTKYLDTESNSADSSDKNTYSIEIDCDKRLFKLEGKKWESSTGDKLMTESIINGCTY